MLTTASVNSSQIPQKIAVFGLPGSGKSTFASRLGNYLGIPVYHLDKFFYINNWIERDYQEFLSIQQTYVNQSKWVIDGNAMHSLEMRFKKADLAIYFHYPMLICFCRILKRYLAKKWPIPDLAEGCKKNVSLRLIKYLLKFHTQYISHIQKLHEKYPHVHFYIFKSNKDLEYFFNRLKS